MKFLLDTNICIALLKGGESSLKSRFLSHAAEDSLLCSVVKAELLFGARNSSRVDGNLKTLEAFFAGFESLPFDDTAANHYGLIRAALRRAGTPIGESDLLISSIALSQDLSVVTRNRSEFLRVPGLRVEEW